MNTTGRWLAATLLSLSGACNEDGASEASAQAMDAAASDDAGQARDATAQQDGSLRLDASAAPDATAATRAAATSRMFEVLREPHLEEAPYFDLTRPRDLSVLGAPLPVIVWANGGCLRLDFPWDPLFQRWAAAGFVVLSLSASPDGDPTGGLLNMFAMSSDADHAALIDWVVEANVRSPYAGKLDLSRIVLAGNSCGGVTALQTAAKDPRAAAVFVLSGSSALGSVDSAVMAAIRVPVGYVIGGDEDIAGANARADYAAIPAGRPAMIVNRRTGDHLTVSSDSAVLAEEAEISLEWMDLALYGTRSAYDALLAPNVCDACTPGDWTLQSKLLETLLQ